MKGLRYYSGVHSIDDDPTALFFVSLGGAGEIGMNLNLYGHAGDWLILDCGVTFGDDSQPGLEVVMPDPAFIVERRDRLLGIVATHAHEDHIGAIPYLWAQLRCPVWATPFTASLLRAKLIEAGIADKVQINVVPISGRFTVNNGARGKDRTDAHTTRSPALSTKSAATPIPGASSSRPGTWPRSSG